MVSGDDGWQAMYEGARRAWPGVTLAFDRFAAHAGRVGFAPQAVADDRDAANAADLFLACACAEGDRAAIRILEEQILAKTRSSLKRLDSRPEFIDDVMQELRAKLLLPPEPRILRYGGRGPLLAWVRVSASRIAIDLMRTSHEEVLPVPREPDSLEGVDFGPEVQLLRAAYRESFQEAISAALVSLSAKDRNLLRRHFVECMTLEEIAGPYAVHPATIARRLMALREQIAGAVRDHLAIRHRSEGGSTALESMARAIRSEVHVSLARLLGRTAEPSDEHEPK